MNDRVLWNATAKQERLQAKVQTLESALVRRRAELQSITDWIATYHEFAGTGSGQSARTVSEPSGYETRSSSEKDDPSVERRRTVRNPRKEVVASIAREIIEEAGRPISRTDLFAALANRGVHINGREPEQVLSTMLWRTQKQRGPVVRLKTGGYWIANRADVESGYIPGGSNVDAVEGATREARMQDAMHEVLMRYELPALKNVEAALEFGDGVPDYVMDLLNDAFPDVFDGESPSDDDFVAMFANVVRSRLNTYERASEDQSGWR